MVTSEYQLVQLRNGTQAVYAASYDEKMHPGLGPAAEAEALYVRQLKIRERMQAHDGEFVVWDVGLGAAANALTLLHLTRDLPCPLRIVSFDDTSGPLEFALTHAESLGYFHDCAATVRRLLVDRNVRFNDGLRTVHWEFNLGDFPKWVTSSTEHPTLDQREPEAGVQALACAEDRLKPELQRLALAAPHAIFYDAFSPAKNPAMWTLPLFTNLFRLLDPTRPCSLTTYSRSTMLRVTLLLAGFFVGRGIPTGLKEETTVAANSLALLDESLDCRWLERAHRSDCAEPLHQPVYRRAALSQKSWAKLQTNPQFKR